MQEPSALGEPKEDFRVSLGLGNPNPNTFTDVILSCIKKRTVLVCSETKTTIQQIQTFRNCGDKDHYDKKIANKRNTEDT